jgi:type IV pilus assembly protein PilM
MNVLSRSKNLVGLDIGSDSIKVAQIEKTRHGFELTKLGMVELLPEAIVEGEVMDRELVIDAISQLFHQHDIKSRNLVTALSSRTVIIKKITMDLMTEEEVRESLKFEAEQHIPFDIDEVTLSFQIIRFLEDINQMEVLLVAAKTEATYSLVELLSDAHLTPYVIDVDIFAIQNAFEFNYEPSPDETVALVNIGSASTIINVFNSGVPLFTRELPIASRTFLQTLQKNLNVNYEFASKILRTGGHPGKESIDLPAILQPAYAELSAAIKRSFTFLKKSEKDQSPIDKIYLCGGAVNSPGLFEYMQVQDSLPVAICDPFEKIYYDPDIFKGIEISSVAPSLMLVIGLALREVI